jgi:hypothetical protein
MSNLEKLGKRLDNILKYIKNEKPKDIWIINNLDILFKEIIETNTSREKENMLTKKVNELLDQYEWRFGETFENLTEGLSPRELELKNQLYNQFKSNKREFIKKYKGNAEQVMTGRAIKTAKNMAMKEQKQRIREIVKNSLANGPVEEINSVEYVQNRKPVDDEKNPIDTVRMDIPLLIRVMEFAKEDAKTDMDLHAAAENMIELSKKDRVLNMDDYNNIVSPDEENQINELVKKVMTKLKA